MNPRFKRPLQVIAGIVIVLLGSVAGLGVFLSTGKSIGQAHFPSDFLEPFRYEGATFDDYRQWSERRLRESRIDEPSEEVINNLLPFELIPDADCPTNPDGRYANGIVLVHGLIASPWSMRYLGEYFQTHCFYVIGTLLHGHGSRPGDMLVSYQEDWQADVAFATRLVAEKAGKVYLSGHSAGATLAVLEATRNVDVDALILFGPAMAVDSASKYAGGISQIGKLFPAAAWFEVEPEEGVYRYESFPFTAAAETWDLIQETQQSLLSHPLDIPVMTVASAQDTTVDTQATFDFMALQTNPLSFTLLYAQHELPPYYRTRVVGSNLPDDGIMSLGHLGLMTPPDHPHYGINGEYRYCGHYYGDGTNNYDRCRNGERDYYGEITDENLGYGLIERIAFNPFWNELLDEIDLFIQQVSMDRHGVPINPGLERTGPLILDE